MLLFFACSSPAEEPEAEVEEEAPELLELNDSVRLYLEYPEKKKFMFTATEGVKYTLRISDSFTSQGEAREKVVIQILTDTNENITPAIENGEYYDFRTFIAPSSGDYIISIFLSEETNIKTFYLKAKSTIMPTSITLNPPGPLTMISGTTQILECTIEPENCDDSVIWSSSNEEFVKIDDNGEIIMSGIGEANIVATSEVDPNFSATCNITTVPVSLNYNEEVSGTVDNEKEMFYSFQTIEGDEFVISHSRGRYAFHISVFNEEMSPIITESTKDEIRLIAASTGTYFIQVKEYERNGNFLINVARNIQPTSLELSQTAPISIISGDYIHLEVSGQPANADLSVIWHSTDSNIIINRGSGSFKANRPGVAVITATSTINSNLSRSLDVTVTGRPITLGEWEWGSVDIRESMFYTFEATAGTDYLFYYEGSHNSDYTLYPLISVTDFDDNLVYTSLSYRYPGEFSVSQSERLIVEVDEYGAMDSGGTFRIKIVTD